MKKSFSYVATFVALFASVACSNKELTPTPDDQGAVLNIRISSTSAGDTKTGVEYDSELKAHLPYWNTGDQIGVFFDGFGSKTKLDAVLANTSADKASEASFSAENITLNNGTVPGAEGRIYSFYPASAFQTNGVVEDDNAVRVNLKGVQNPAAVDTYDPAADILVGQPSDYMYEEGLLVADVAFARAMSIVKVTLKDGSECPDNLAVNSFTMTAPEGTILTGRAKLSLAALYDDASPILDWTVGNNAVTAKYDANFHPVIGGAENTVYVVVNPTSIASGNIVFNIDTDGYTIEKTVTLSKALTFPQSNVANIGLTIEGANCSPKVTETRIYVENFDSANPKDGKEQLAPNATGAKGTGVTNDLTYTYSTNNTNIRNNSTNGHGNSNPYLWISGADQYLIISNITVASETALKFTCQTWTTQSTATVTIQYKESSSDTWVDAGTMDASQSTKNTEQNILFTVDEENTSIDIKILGSTGNLVVDDIVLEKFVDTRETLANPTNVSASLDSEVPNKINVSWTAVEHADKYEVVLSAADEDDVVLEPTTNTASAAGLSYEKEYAIKVKAVTTDSENYIDSDYVNAASTVTTGAKPAGAATWDETAFADLAEGDQVVIVGTSSDNTYAMSNNNGTSSAPAAVSINVAGTALAADPAENLIWYVGVSDGNKIFYSDEDNTKWLYCTATNNGVRVGDNTNKTFTWDNSYNYLKHVGTGRYIGVYDTSDWRCYSVSNPSTHGNIGSQTFKFYVCSNKETKYSVSVEEVDGGTLSADPTKATEGATVTLSAEANEGWQFNDDWSVDNGNVTVTDGTFTMPARNVNVTGSFSKKNLTITKAAATNGSFDVKVNSSVVSTAQVGDEVTLVVNPDPNYELKSWTVYKTGDENTKVTVTNNAFTMPAYPVTVAVEFKDASSGPSYGDPVTATITFGANNVKINAASVTGDDTQENTWTITTVGTTSFTSNTAYYQVGSSNKPATSITFTTTLPKNAKVTAMSAKFGGFSGTAGTVTLKVGDETLKTGSLNAANDVTVSVSNKEEVGKVLTVTLTGIAKGVKVYNISATYQLEN